MGDAAQPPVFADAALKHRIPVIDRMMEVLILLERRDGATIRDLVDALELPRTTVYRILNTLQLHDMVRRNDGGAYQLGGRLHRSPRTSRPVPARLILSPSLANPSDKLADTLGEV